MPDLLEVRGLKKHFAVRRGLFGSVAATVRAVDGVDFAIGKGETLGLVGESGSGKSTTGRCVLRLIEPDAGSIRLGGEELAGMPAAALKALRPRMQMVFQDPQSFLNPRMTVGEIVAEPLRLRGSSRARARDAAVARLEEVGLSADDLARRPASLSGGQKQRVGIARALALEPELLIADEPVSALDASVRSTILELLAGLKRARTLTLLFIAHDLRAVAFLSDRIAVMYLGRIVEIAPAKELFARPRHPYSEALLASMPVADLGAIRARRGAPLPPASTTDPPDPAAPPSGCRFRTRCPYVQPVCAETDPLLIRIGASSSACHFAETLSLKGVTP